MLQLSVLYEVIGEFWEIDPYNALPKCDPMMDNKVPRITNKHLLRQGFV